MDNKSNEIWMEIPFEHFKKIKLGNTGSPRSTYLSKKIWWVFEAGCGVRTVVSNIGMAVSVVRLGSPRTVNIFTSPHPLRGPLLQTQAHTSNEYIVTSPIHLLVAFKWIIIVGFAILFGAETFGNFI